MEVLSPPMLHIPSSSPYRFPPDPFNIAQSELGCSLIPSVAHLLHSNAVSWVVEPRDDTPALPDRRPTLSQAMPARGTPQDVARMSVSGSTLRPRHLSASQSKSETRSSRFHHPTTKASPFPLPPPPSLGRGEAPPRIKTTPRPGTAAVVQAAQSSSSTSSRTLRRASSLNESILPSYRSRSIHADSLQSSYKTSASPLVDAPAASHAVEPLAPSLLFGRASPGRPSGTGRGHITDTADTIWENRRKFWHTLMELVVTERGYLSDLRVLVSVRRSLPWALAFCLIALSSPMQVYLDHLPKYFAISAEDMSAVARNAQQLLNLHEALEIEFSQIEQLLLSWNQISDTDPAGMEAVLAQGLDWMARKLVSSVSSSLSVCVHWLMPFCSLSSVEPFRNLPKLLFGTHRST